MRFFSVNGVNVNMLIQALREGKYQQYFTQNSKNAVEVNLLMDSFY